MFYAGPSNTNRFDIRCFPPERVTLIWEQAAVDPVVFADTHRPIKALHPDCAPVTDRHCQGGILPVRAAPFREPRFRVAPGAGCVVPPWCEEFVPVFTKKHFDLRGDASTGRPGQCVLLGKQWDRRPTACGPIVASPDHVIRRVVHFTVFTVVRVGPVLHPGAAARTVTRWTPLPTFRVMTRCDVTMRGFPSMLTQYRAVADGCANVRTRIFPVPAFSAVSAVIRVVTWIVTGADDLVPSDATNVTVRVAGNDVDHVPVWLTGTVHVTG